MPIQGRLPRIITVLLKENVRYALSWVALLLVGGITFYYAWTSFDLAREIHRDLEHSLKYAKVWGSGVFEGQTVKRDHELLDSDVVELHV